MIGKKVVKYLRLLIVYRNFFCVYCSLFFLCIFVWRNESIDFHLPRAPFIVLLSQLYDTQEIVFRCHKSWKQLYCTQIFTEIMQINWHCTMNEVQRRTIMNKIRSNELLRRSAFWWWSPVNRINVLPRYISTYISLKPSGMSHTLNWVQLGMKVNLLLLYVTAKKKPKPHCIF